MKLSVSEILKKTVEGIESAKGYLSKKVQETGDYLSEKVKDVAGQYVKLQEEANKKLVDACDKLGVNLTSLSSAVANAVKAIRDSIGNGGKSGKKLNGTSSNRAYTGKKPKQPEGVKQISGPGMPKQPEGGKQISGPGRPKNITISSDKGDSGAGKYSVSKDKQADKNISVGKKPPAKKKEPEYDPPPYRKPRKEPEAKDPQKSKPDPEKRRKKPKSKDLPQADTKSDRRDKKSSNGGIKKAGSGKVVKSLLSGGNDINDAINKIANIQNSIENVATAVNKVAETGDLTPLVNELAKIPGPIGQIASVASQSFKIGNQMYDFYMKNLGGQERLDKETEEESTRMNNAYKEGDKSIDQSFDKRIKIRLKALVENGIMSQDEADQKFKQFLDEKKENRKHTYTEVQNSYFTMVEDQKNEKRLGKDKLASLQKTEDGHKDWYATENKKIQDDVGSGKLEAGSDKYFARKQDLQLEAIKRFRKMRDMYRSLGMNTKTIQTENRIREEEANFAHTSTQRRAAIKNRSDKDIVGEAGKGDKLGETTAAKIKRAEEELASYNMEYRAINKKDPSASVKESELTGKMRTTSEKISRLKKELAVEKSGGAGSSKVAMSSDCGKKLDDLKSMLDTELSEGNIKKSVDKILEEMKKYYPGDQYKTAGPTNSPESDDMGFGGDVNNPEAGNSLVAGSSKAAGTLKTALGSSSNRLAHDPGIARATISLPATATTPQQSSNDIHQTLKRVKEIIDKRLPGESF